MSGRDLEVKAIEPKIVDHLCQLFEDVPKWELSADVDFDQFNMPRLPILQLTKPSTFVQIKEKQKPFALKMDEPLAKFFLKCSGGDRQAVSKDFEELQKIRIFFTKASQEEKKIASGAM